MCAPDLVSALEIHSSCDCKAEDGQNKDKRFHWGGLECHPLPRTQGSPHQGCSCSPGTCTGSLGFVCAWHGLKGSACNNNLVLPLFTLIKFLKLEKEVTETGPRNPTNQSLNCRCLGWCLRKEPSRREWIGERDKQGKKRELVEILRTPKHKSWV